jgi:dienelactone hydrolase
MKTGYFAAAGLSLLSFAAIAQLPAGFSMEAVNTVLPEEGAPKPVPGKYTVTSSLASGNDALRVYRPEKLDAFPKRDKLPVVVWGNGGCAIDNPRYRGFLETIASHGFLVITTTTDNAPAAAPGAAPAPAPGPGPGAGAPGAAPRRSATAESLKAAIDWAEKENARAGSPLAGKVDTSQVAVMGSSCGGRLSLELGADPRVKTIGVFNAGVTPDQFKLLAPLHGPVLMINGHERDFMMADSKATYDAIDKLPAFYGARHGAGHTATLYHAGGGEFANVASNWVRWQFKNDKKAAKMFVGNKCELCTNKNWDAVGKRLK